MTHIDIDITMNLLANSLGSDSLRSSPELGFKIEPCGFQTVVGSKPPQSFVPTGRADPGSFRVRTSSGPNPGTGMVSLPIVDDQSATMRCLPVGIFFTACYWACTIFGYTGLTTAPRINWRRFSATFHGNLTTMRRPKSRLGFGLVGCLEDELYAKAIHIARRRSILEWRGGPVSMKRLTALIVVLLVALATCEAVVAVLGSSHRLPVVLTGA